MSWPDAGPDGTQEAEARDEATHADASHENDASVASTGDAEGGIAPDVTTPDVTTPEAGPEGGADGGILGEELAFPWREGSCELWTQVPFPGAGAPVESSEGLWAVGRWYMDPPPSAKYLDFVMRFAQGTWHVTRMPKDAWLVQAPGGVALVSYDRVLVRKAGAWVETSPPLPIDMDAKARWGSPAELLVASSSNCNAGLCATWTLERFDGASWTTLPPMSSDGWLWSDGSTVYAGHSAGVRRLVGGTWKELFVPSPAFYRVAGVSSSQVFAIAGSGLFSVGADALTAEPGLDCGGGSAAYDGIQSDGGKVVVFGSCSNDSSRRAWTNDTSGWKTTILPAPTGTLSAPTMTASSIYALDVDARGSYDYPNAIVRLAGGMWQSLVTQPAPSARVVTGRSPTELYAGAGTGLAKLSSTSHRWETPPGISPLDVRGLWQAPNGTLFIQSFDGACVYKGMGTTTLWRYDGMTLQRDLDVVSTCTTFDLRGRSESDAYAVIGKDIYHWNGSAWGAPLATPCTYQAANLAPLGTRGVVVTCADQNSVVFAHDGTSWKTLGGPYPVYALGNVGPSASPTAYVIEPFWPGGTQGVAYVAGHDSGWLSGTFPPGIAPRTLRGPDANHLVAFGLLDPNSAGYGLARSDGSAPWTVTTNWITDSIITAAPYIADKGNLERFWSDGRFAVLAKDLASPAIGRCDLGSGP